MNDSWLNNYILNLSKTPGILDREKYLNSVVLIPLIRFKEGYHFLFEKRASHISQGNEICFPGGRTEQAIDSDYRSTAIRETVEELGIQAARITVLGRLDTLIASGAKIIEAFIGRLNIDSLDELHPNPNEVAEVFTLPVDYFIAHPPKQYSVETRVYSQVTDSNGNLDILLPAAELGLPSRYHTYWGEYRFPVYVFDTPQGIIWGITARYIAKILKLT